MLRVLIMLHDANNSGRTRVLDELKIVNDGTGDSLRGNYNVTRFSDVEGIDHCRIIDYPREQGAMALVKTAIEKLGP